jgi:hypothetical protein
MKCTTLDEEMKDDRSAKNMDRGQLNMRKKPPLDALEHCTRRKERRRSPEKEGMLT